MVKSDDESVFKSVQENLKNEKDDSAEDDLFCRPLFESATDSSHSSSGFTFFQIVKRK